MPLYHDNTKDESDRDLAILEDFVQSTPELYRLNFRTEDCTISHDGRFNGFLSRDGVTRIDRRALNAALRARYPFHKEPAGSSPDYYVTFKGHRIYFQYDNSNRSYIQLSLMELAPIPHDTNTETSDEN